MRVQELTELEQLECFASAWAELHARCPRATPFQTPDWLIPWCLHYSRWNLHVLCFYKDEELVGFAPRSIYRAGDARVLTLLGSCVGALPNASASTA